MLDTDLTTCKTLTPEDTHHVICSLPDFYGQRYTRLRSDQLQQIANDASGVQVELAAMELKRRNFYERVIEDLQIDITLHAIDSLSIRHMHRYLSRNEGEGISEWCFKRLKEAYYAGQRPNTERDTFSLSIDGMTFVLNRHYKYPRKWVLATIK